MSLGSEDRHQRDEIPTSELLQRRDPESIQELLRRYRPLLKAIVAGEIDPLLRSKMDASDLVQDACVEIVKSFENVQAKRSSQFLAYVREILFNKLRDARRRFLLSQKRDARLERPAGKLALDDAAMTAEDDGLAHLIHEELWLKTQLALSKCPPEIYKVLHMRFVRGMTYREIGERVNRGEDDVRMFVGRCLKKLRKAVLADASSSS